MMKQRREIETAQQLYHSALGQFRAVRAQMASMSNKRPELEVELQHREGRVRQLAEAHEKILADNAAGVADQSAVESSATDLANARRSVESTREQLTAIRHQQPRVQAEYERLRSEAAQAREALAGAVWGLIEQRLRADRKLRRSLLEIYAAVRLSTSTELATHGRCDWPTLLADVFPEPEQDEYELIHNEFARYFDDRADAGEAA